MVTTADSALRFDLFARDRTGPGVKSAESSFGKLGKGLVTKFAAAGAALGGISLLGDFISEARESEKVSRLTANAIKATGGAAKVSADEVGALAMKLSNKTAVDDEAIQSGQNLLLTFKGIRNEAGKGNDIFDQASAAILDMTAGMNNGVVTQENLKGTSVQLGKALNDPIKGITALTRSGVTFTDAQKAQIKSMVAAGDTMGAQKIILGELKSEFGGAAEAAADPAQKATVAWGNLKEQLGTQLLPTFNKVMGFVSNKVIPGISSLVTNLRSGGGGFATFRSGLSAVGNFITGTVVPALKRFGDWFTTTGWPAIKAFAQGLWTSLQPALAQISTTFQTQLRPAIEHAIAKFKEAWPTIQRVGGILISIGQVILTKVVPVLVKFTGTYLANTIRVMSSLFSAAWRVIGVLIDIGKAIGNAGAAFGRFVGAVSGAIGKVVSSVTDGIGKAVSEVKAFPGKAINAIGNLGSSLYQFGIDFIQGFINGIIEKAKAIPGEIKDKVVDVAKNALSGAKGFLFGSPSKLTMKYGRWFSEGFAIGINDGADKVQAKVAALVDKLKAKLDKVKEFAKGIRDSFSSMGDLTGIDTMLTDAAGNQRDGGIGTLLAGLRSQVGAAQEFASTLTALRKAGLNNTSLANLREAGPEGGLKAAQQLLSGGGGAISEVNSLMKSLAATGKAFAGSESKAMHGFSPYDKNGLKVGAGGQTVTVEFKGSGDELTEAIVKALRKKVKNNGGDVEQVLGTGKKK